MEEGISFLILKKLELLLEQLEGPQNNKFDISKDKKHYIYEVSTRTIQRLLNK